MDERFPKYFKKVGILTAGLTLAIGAATLIPRRSASDIDNLIENSSRVLFSPNGYTYAAIESEDGPEGKPIKKFVVGNEKDINEVGELLTIQGVKDMVWSEDGRYLAFTISYEGFDVLDLYTYDTGTNQTHPVFMPSAEHNFSNPRWRAENQLVFDFGGSPFVSEPDGTNVKFDLP